MRLIFQVNLQLKIYEENAKKVLINNNHFPSQQLRIFHMQMQQSK